MSARVLIVDDILPNLKLLGAKLDREYFEVLTAQSGEEALEVIERETPDIVLLDVMMPGMDGFEVCRRIKAKESTSYLPVIMVTALDQPADRVKGLEAGADDFLTKPLDDLALYARLRSLVRLKLMIDELRNRETTSAILGDAAVVDVSAKITDAHMLLLDSTGDEAEKVRQWLGIFGQVDVARTAEEVEELATRITFDVILIPVQDGEMDGLRICSRLRTAKETRGIPLLTIANQDNRDRLIKGMDLGVNDYIVRPLDALELVARVRTQLRRKRFADRLRENLHMSIKLATTDSVTGLYNRHYMTSHLATMVATARAQRKPMSFAILDLDKFKLVNDTHGHTAGDEVLSEFAARISENVRGVDLAARYGGEEFVVIMPDTNLGTARHIAERLRKVVADEPFVVSDGKKSLDITVSIGLAELIEDDKEPVDLMERADEALYDAKGAGRNQVSVAESGTSDQKLTA